MTALSDRAVAYLGGAQTAHAQGEDLLPVGLPLPWVDRSAVAEPGEIAVAQQWPPQRLLPRQARLDDLLAAWQGDLTRWARTASAVATAMPFGRRFTGSVSQLLGAEPPVIVGGPGDGPEVEAVAEQIETAAVDAIEMSCRYGRSWLGAIRDGGTLTVTAIDPRLVVPLTTGETATVHLAQDASSDAPRPGVLDVCLWRSTGLVERYAGTWEAESRLGIGAITSLRLVAVYGGGVIRHLDCLPRGIDGWGVGMVEDLLPAMWQHAIRLGSGNRILDMHEHPMVIWRGGERDYSSLLPPDTPESNTDAELETVLRRWRRHQVAAVPNVAMKIDYLTWQGHLQDSAAMLDRLEALMRMLTDVPSLLESGSAMPTGSALRRLMLPLYARTRQAQVQATRALRDAVRLLWPDATVEWQHVLDALSGDGQAEPDHAEPDDDSPMDGTPDMDAQAAGDGEDGDG